MIEFKIYYYIKKITQPKVYLVSGKMSKQHCKSATLQQISNVQWMVTNSLIYVEERSEKKF